MRYFFGSMVIAILAGPAAAQQIGGSGGIVWNGPGTAMPSISVGGSGFPKVNTDAWIQGGDNAYGRGLVIGSGPNGIGAGTAYTFRAPNGELVSSTFNLVVAPNGAAFGSGHANGFGPGSVHSGGTVGVTPAGPFASVGAGGTGSAVNATTRTNTYGVPQPYFPPPSFPAIGP